MYIFRKILVPVLSVVLSSSALAEVNWQPWDKASFAQAVQHDKLILINVGMEGCTACNRMEKHTYSDPAVIELLNQHFVSIAVDSQARPDVGERYSDWAWPATAFLMPDGTQVFAMAGNRLPENFLPILEDLIAKQRDGSLKPDPDSPYASAAAPVTSPLTELRDRLRQQLDNAFYPERGGWSSWGVNAENDGAKLAHLYFRAHLLKDKELQKHAIHVSETFLKTLDPVWGGAFEANIHPDAKGVPAEFAKLRAIPEKRISNQANALHAFATAYRLTGDSRFLSGIESIDRFLDEWMLSRSGTWFSNQKDTPPQMPRHWWPQDYWSLDSDAKRRQYGVPPVDHAIYSDKNAEIILGYIAAYQASGKADYLEKAKRAAMTLLTTHRSDEGWLRQSLANEELKSDDRLRPHAMIERPLLITQARFGKALLALYQQTADRHWLDAAQSIADSMLTTLHDAENGGFWATAPNDKDPIAPRKPLEYNAVAGQFFYQLAVLNKLPRYSGVAESTLRAVATEGILRREGRAVAETALLAELLTALYVEFTVVTHQPELAKSQQLYQTGLEQYHPRKLIHFEPPGRYPDIGEPVMFICNPNRCSVPLKTPAQVQQVAELY